MKLALGLTISLCFAAQAARPPPEAALGERFDAIQADLDAIRFLLPKLKGKAKVAAEAKTRLERAVEELEELEQDTRGTGTKCPPCAPCPPAGPCPPCPAVAVCPPPPPEPPMALLNGASTLCLGVAGVDRHRAGEAVHLAVCVGERNERPLDHQWSLAPADSGFELIRNEVSGLCLGVRGVDQATLGAEAEVFDCTAVRGDARLDNQWRRVETARGAFQLRNRVSGLCLGVKGGDRHEPGALAVLDNCDAPRRGRDTLWSVVPYAGVFRTAAIERGVAETPVRLAAITAPDFAKVLKALDAESFDAEKMRVLKLALVGKPVTVAQVKDVIARFSFPAEKVEVVRLLNATIVDRDNRYQLLESFTFDSDKSAVEAIIR